MRKALQLSAGLAKIHQWRRNSGVGRKADQSAWQFVGQPYKRFRFVMVARVYSLVTIRCEIGAVTVSDLHRTLRSLKQTKIPSRCFSNRGLGPNLLGGSNVSIVYEEWRSVKGVAGYQVSNFGRVRSLSRMLYTKRFKNGRPVEGKVLSQTRGRNGYMSVWLGRECGKHRVHGLIAEAFIGQRPIGLDVNHKDGNKRNNHADNLEYVTRGENIRHSVRIGTFHKTKKKTFS